MSSAKPQALVTGATRGIGRATCLELARAGYDLAFTYRSNDELAHSLTEELKVIGCNSRGYKVDMADLNALQSTLEKILTEFNQVQVLVNNAGISIDGLALRFKPEDFDKLMNTNLRAAFYTTQALLKPMMKARNGSIVFMSSVIGEMGNAGQSVYAATKAGLIAMAKSLAKEVGSRGIRINAITPGFIDTDMTSSLPAAHKESITSQIPLGVLGTPEDVAKAVAFLASPASKYITGQVLAVNGGLYMRA